MFWCAIYIALIVGVNVGFELVPMADLGPLGMWPPMSVFVGFVFIVRDLAQRAAGHRVLWAMAAGIALSYFMASPFIALASAAAFAASELVDWLVFTFYRSSFRARVIASSSIGVPVDSFVFLAGIGALSPVAFVVMTASKMLALVCIAGYKRDVRAVQ